MYARKSILKGSHHRRFHRSIFAITWFQQRETMHHWATTGNFLSFFLMGNYYHKRHLFYLENWEQTAYNSFYGLSLIALIGYRRENWSVVALRGHLVIFALFIKSNMIYCIYLIDLNLIKSKYIFVCTTFLLNVIFLLFWFDFKSISVAILFRFYLNIIFIKQKNLYGTGSPGALDVYTMILFTEKRKVFSW